MSGPSEAAVRAALAQGTYVEHVSTVRAALAAAHDPANFTDPLDVSVRLGDVVEALETQQPPGFYQGPGLAAMLVRTFGAKP